MKKLISILVLISVSLFSLMAQNSIRETGNFSIDAGLGLGTVSSGYSMAMPPLKVDAEYTVLTFGTGSFSVGAYLSLGIDRLKSYDMSVTTFLIGPMASVRYGITNDIDIFGKLILGYVGVSTSDTLVNSFVQGNHTGGGVYVGGTWYFSSKMGLGGEIGYGGPTTFGVHLTFMI
jgi:hypothetical protein